ncbi:hypothetical protein [Leisingera sp. JC11]|uniref:hypothetical protein n=1 Tax=Leisingera sp. JC11 TaxID=3042469 RepID=UPI0034529BBD
MTKKSNEGRDLLEEAAFEFLQSKFACVCYEPNGESTFPDFLANDTVLFEVTRLEKTVAQGGNSIHHSCVYVPFLQSIESAIKKFPRAIEGDRDLFVGLTVRFPIDKSVLRQNLREYLRKVVGTPLGFVGKEVELSDGVTARIVPGSKSTHPKIYLGSVNPVNLTGWVIPDTIDQVNEALERKGSKLQSYTGKYDEAWLVVGGGASPSLRSDDIQLLQSGINSGLGWAGLVIINSHDPKRSIEFRIEG